MVIFCLISRTTHLLSAVQFVYIYLLIFLRYRSHALRHRVLLSISNFATDSSIKSPHHNNITWIFYSIKISLKFVYCHLVRTLQIWLVFSQICYSIYLLFSHLLFSFVLFFINNYTPLFALFSLGTPHHRCMYSSVSKTFTFSFCERYIIYAWFSYFFYYFRPLCLTPCTYQVVMFKVHFLSLSRCLNREFTC